MFSNLRNFSRARLERIRINDGFTLLEIVIAIGVLLIITSGATIAIRGMDQRAKQAAVDSAVKDVYNAAYSYMVDGSSATKPQDAATSYNESQKLNRKGNLPIEVVVTELPGNRIRVMAFHDGGQAQASYESPIVGGLGDGSGGSGGGGVIVPVIEDTITQLTYNCNERTAENYLPIYNLKDGTTVSIIGSDGSSKLVRYNKKPNNNELESGYAHLDATADTGWSNISEKLTMETGITYTVKVYGKFTNFSAINLYTENTATGANKSFKDCLVSVDKLGEHSGIVTMNYIGGKKLNSVPENIPASVTSIFAIFYSAYYLNDPNITKWDVSNIIGKGFEHSFVAADYFNQDLSSWDISNATSLTSTFYSADRYNNGGKPLNWDTSNITSLSSTFRYARAFNQSLDTRYDSAKGATYWDVSKVSNMSRAFQDAIAFNNGNAAGVQKAMKWNTVNATNMGYMFYNTESFNANVRRTTVASGGYDSWNTNKVVYMQYMFAGASKFNASVGNWTTNSLQRTESMFEGASKFNASMASGTYWNVSKVTNMTSMFKNATAFNQNLSSWNVDKVGSNHANFADGARFQSTVTYHPNWVS